MFGGRGLFCFSMSTSAHRTALAAFINKRVRDRIDCEKNVKASWCIRITGLNLFWLLQKNVGYRWKTSFARISIDWWSKMFFKKAFLKSHWKVKPTQCSGHKHATHRNEKKYKKEMESAHIRGCAKGDQSWLLFQTIAHLLSETTRIAQRTK